MRQHIKIKLKKSELHALQQITCLKIMTTDPVGYKAQITYELMFEVMLQMERMLENPEQKKFTLKLTGSEAMAFIAFWMEEDLSKVPYEQVLIHRITAAIHKNHLNAKHQTS